MLISLCGSQPSQLVFWLFRRVAGCPFPSGSQPMAVVWELCFRMVNVGPCSFILSLVLLVACSFGVIVAVWSWLFI